MLFCQKSIKFATEHLLVRRLTWHLASKEVLSTDQYGFTPHKSTENALSRLCEIVSNGKKKNLFTILVFMDIKGAFDNAWWPAIIKQLKNVRAPANILHLYKNFLHNRKAELTIGGVKKVFLLEKGCPQGSVSGPILWNLLINDLLIKLSSTFDCYKIAFADDLLLVFQGKDFRNVCSLAQDVLDFAVEWSRLFKLEFHPNKTKAMMVYKKFHDNAEMFLKLGNNPIQNVEEMKYLGIIIDHKFHWKRHISYISSKAEKLLRGFYSICKNSYGINTDTAKLIYNQGIVPVISYAVNIWGDSLRKKINQKCIRKLQRRFLLRIAKGYRTISYEALFALTGIAPLDIVMRNSALARNAFIQSGSDAFLNGTLPVVSLPHPSLRTPINLVDFEKCILDDYDILCFTDGSKMNEKVGLAFVLFQHDLELFYQQFRISDNCSVFQAELLCLNLAVKHVLQYTGARILICSDSLSSLLSLCDIRSFEKLVVEVQSILSNTLDIYLDFMHVRGHTGIYGNQRADFSAKGALRLPFTINFSKLYAFWKNFYSNETFKE